MNELHEKLAGMGKNEQPFLLHGPPGTGKTTLMNEACAMVSNPRGGSISYRTRHMWLDRRVLWAQSGEFCRDVKNEISIGQRWSDFDDHYSASGISRIVPCMFIDDLGTEQETDYNTESISSLVDARYRVGLPTWFTTNLTIAEIGSRYGDRTLSRLAEMCEFITIGGEDRRMTRKRAI